jgi:antitoxin (DNA-binding transcriptional repressor) of toxin-antitoxin stability system
MLIDTKQIVPITDLRLRLTEIIDAAYAGKTFYVSERGKITAKITAAEVAEKERRLKLLKEIEKLRGEIDQRLKKSKKKVWNSVEVIRKMRQERTKHLLSLSKQSL